VLGMTGIGEDHSAQKHHHQDIARSLATGGIVTTPDGHLRRQGDLDSSNNCCHTFTAPNGCTNCGVNPSRPDSPPVHPFFTRDDN